MWLDAAMTVGLDAAQVERWGARRKGCVAVTLIDAPSEMASMGANHHLVAWIGGKWVRVWRRGGVRRGQKLTEGDGSRMTQWRRARAAQDLDD